MLKIPTWQPPAGAMARLWRTAIPGVIAAGLDAAPWAVLIVALHLMSAGAVSPLAIAAVAMALVALFLLGWLARAMGLLASFTETYDLVANLRLAAADLLGRMPLGAVMGGSAAARADFFTEHFTLFQDIATHLWWKLWPSVATPLFLWALLLWIDWRLGLTMALFAPVATAVMPWSLKRLDAAASQLVPARDAVAAHCVGMVTGIKELRVHDPRNERAAAARGAIAELRAMSFGTEIAPAPALFMFGFIWSLAFAATASVSCVLWSRGDISPVMLISALIVAARACDGLADVGALTAEWRIATRLLGGIRTFFSAPLMAQTTAPQAAAQKTPRGVDVCFDAVRFSHVAAPESSGSVGEAVTLRNISLTVPAGTCLALVGHSGAGKSTLAGLVARLWDVDAGAVRLGGVDVREMTAHDLNAHVAMVLQDVELFSMSIRDNIRLGRPDASPETVIEAAEAAQIHDRIMQLPHGYDTLLDRATVMLSGGERQRLAIARALVKDAPVLILDEMSVSLDPDCEVRVRAAVAALMRGRTTILIAHRLWTVTDADQIAVLEGGAMAETGTHDELLAYKGAYAQMWAAQEAGLKAV